METVGIIATNPLYLGSTVLWVMAVCVWITAVVDP
jgi:hypothetical protein